MMQHLFTFVKLFLSLQVLTTVTSDIIPCNSSSILSFQCEDGLTCVNRKRDFCSGTAECPDGSDEYVFDPSMASERGMECAGQGISCHLPTAYQCDHELDCYGGKDECGCVHTFQCDNGDCAVKVQFCDGHRDCTDGTDEVLYNRTTKLGFQCPVTRFHETNICVLPDQYVCDGDSDCDNGIDECFCSETGVYMNDTFANDKCFRCLDGSLIIPNKYLCDEIIHCPDLSDECLCTDKKNYTMPEICETVCDGHDCICPGNAMCVARGDSGSAGETCLPLEYICDTTFDCENGFDENYCPEEHQFFMCYNNESKIRKSLVCNGFPDCTDGSDEDHCPDIFDYYCSIYRSRLDFITDWENETQTDQINLQEQLRRANVTALTPGFPLYAFRCDGVPMCPNLDDECHAPGCEGARPGYCDFVEGMGSAFRCPNSHSVIIGREICDGMPNCNDTNPELSADELHCPNRFYCANNGSTRLPIHLPLSSKCDGIQECDDQSDEWGCSEDTHFYCNDTGSTTFIRRTEVCDGTLDCASGDDECQDCNPNPFSDDESLITSRVLVVLLWIIGLVAVVGNLSVMAHQLKALINRREVTSAVAISNKYLVLNLSVADLLVGVYLVALGIKDATVTNYCTLDTEWRSGVTCRALGTIALIGTEASVFIILLMAGYRMYLITRPFAKLKTAVVKVTIGVAWLCALLLALLPHAPSLIDYFVSCVWYRSNHFFGYICRDGMVKFSEELLKRSNLSHHFRILSEGKTWHNMFEAIQEIDPSSVPERYFGYYSAHSVCLPRLFPDRAQDNSWGYSMFLIVINFAALIFILISYLQIYRESTRNKTICKMKVRNRAADLQKKISRIVLTDFCCWMPICIMAFVKVSGVYVSDTAYAVTAVILLPINAAINPFLYSSIIDIVWEKMMPIRKLCSKTPCGENCVEDQSPGDDNSMSIRRAANTRVTEVPVIKDQEDSKDDYTKI